jgi:hypothetical protein
MGNGVGGKYSEFREPMIFTLNLFFNLQKGNSCNRKRTFNIILGIDDLDELMNVKKLNLI